MYSFIYLNIYLFKELFCVDKEPAVNLETEKFNFL